MKIGPWRSKAGNAASRPKSPKPATSPANMRLIERGQAIDNLCADGMTKAEAEAEFDRRDARRGRKA